MASLGAVLFLLAALLPLPPGHAATVRRGLGAAAVLTLLPAAGAPGAWPFLLLGAGAAGLGAPLALGLAAAGAIVVALGPGASAPLSAAVAGVAVAAAAAALEASLRARRVSGGDPAVPALGAAGLLVAVLALVDHRALLSWSFGVGAGDARVLLPGVGPALGLGLVLGVGGVLLLGAGILAPAAAARRAGLVVLGPAAALVAAGLALAVFRASSLEDVLRAESARTLTVLVAAAAVLGVALMEARQPAPTGEPHPGATGPMLPRLAAGLAAAAALTAGLESWWRAGAYATEATAAAVAAACLGLAALEPERHLAATRQVLLLVALLWLLVG